MCNATAWWARSTQWSRRWFKLIQITARIGSTLSSLYPLKNCTSIIFVRPWINGKRAEMDTLYPTLKNVNCSYQHNRTGFSSATRFHCSDVRSREWLLCLVTDGLERTAVLGNVDQEGVPLSTIYHIVTLTTLCLSACICPCLYLKAVVATSLFQMCYQAASSSNGNFNGSDFYPCLDIKYMPSTCLCESCILVMKNLSN